jgi:hypothetical protein
MHSSCCRPYQQAASNQAIKQPSLPPMTSRKKKIGRKKPQDQFGHKKQKIPNSRRRRRIPKRKKKLSLEERRRKIALATSQCEE